MPNVQGEILEAYRRFARRIKKHCAEDHGLDILEQHVEVSLASLEDEIVGIYVKAQVSYREPV